MTVKFRNLDISPDQPVEAWPGEAVQTAIERGSLNEWRRLMAAVRRDPWGRTARQIEQALAISRPYGIAPALERAIEAVRREQAERERQAVAERVRRLIEASGLTRAEFAARIGTSPSRLSTYATGKVVPSAAMLVRMEQLVSDSTPRQHAREAGRC
ncbi:MAG: hypothetical protein Kow0020_09190 [Wenzhouxiangellaceae bacterium]